MKNFKKSKTKTSKTKVLEYFSRESFIFVFFSDSPFYLPVQNGKRMLKVLKMIKKSKTKTSKGKTLADAWKKRKWSPRS